MTTVVISLMITSLSLTKTVYFWTFLALADRFPFPAGGVFLPFEASLAFAAALSFFAWIYFSYKQLGQFRNNLNSR